jgi:hypothetical protein
MMDNAKIIEEKYAEAVQGFREEWLVVINENWYNHIVNLQAPLQITYMVVVMHNQVFNGGFHQYFVNGYGQFAKETIDSLTQINAIKRADLLRKALLLVNKENLPDHVFRELLLKKKLDALVVSDELDEPLDELDSIYYNIEDEDIVELLGNYLRVH